jgi:hypothetical protein
MCLIGVVSFGFIARRNGLAGPSIVGEAALLAFGVDLTGHVFVGFLDGGAAGLE